MNVRNLLRSRKLFNFLVIFSLFFTMTVFGGTKMVVGQEQAVESIEIKSVGPSPGEDLTAASADNNITELSFWDDNYGTIKDLFVIENRMYLALGTEGFRVYDITDLDLQLVTSWDLYSCNNIYVEDDLVFVSNDTGFNVVDISDTANPEWVCNWFSPDGVFALAAHGNYVYLASSDDFIVVNITDRNNPVDIWTTMAFIDEMHYVNGYVYTADILGFIGCYNVTDPFSMIREDTIGSGGAKYVYYSENFIYYATPFRASVVNATEKDNLIYLSEFLFNDTSYGIEVRNNHLFVNEGDKLEIFDWTNKTNPVYTYEYTDAEIDIFDFYIYGNYAFAYSTYAVEILDISNPVNITSAYFEVFDGITKKIFLDGDYAFVADHFSLEILDITNLANVTKVSSYHDYSIGGPIVDLFVRNGYIYLLEEDHGDSIMVILSITDPANPVYQGNISFTGQSMDIYVDDEFAYVAQAWNGLAIIDIYYPDYPMKSLQYDELGWIWGVKKFGDNLILAAEDYMHVVDVTNPYNPEQIGNFTRPNANYWGVEIQNNHGFFICDEGFDIIDLTDLLEPVKVGQFFTYEDPHTLKVDGQYVYLIDGNLGLMVCDTENIVHPRLIGQYDDLATHKSLAIRNGYIFLAEGADGTRILVSNPLLYSVEDTPFGLISFVGGFVLFSVIGLLMRKKRKK